MSADDILQPGRRLGDLVIEAELGQGQFGTVFRARDEIIGRPVALKVLRASGDVPPDPDDRIRFHQEARAVGLLNHPNVVTLHHVHALPGGELALEMEYVGGGTLEDVLGEDRRLPVTEAVAIARDLASALAAAHAAGIVHGDVKPANAMRTKDGRTKLGDFGLARLQWGSDPAASRMGIAGTPCYMAPEVVLSVGSGPASDVWSLGVLVYQALAGRLPFDQTEFPALFAAIQNAAPAPLGPEVPPFLARLVERMLAKRSEERPTTAEVFAALGARTSTAQAAVVATSVPFRAGSLPKTTVVGRTAETDWLAKAMDGLLEGQGSVRALTGPAGIGKSMLAAWLAERARGRGIRTIEASITRGEGMLRPLLRRAHETARTPTDPRETGPFAVERVLVDLAREARLLVVLEDLHLATADDVRMLVKLRRRLTEVPVLWLLTERTSDLGLAGSERLRVQPLIEEIEGSRLEVGHLAAPAIYSLLEQNAGEEGVSAGLADRIARRSGGNPLLAIQLLRHQRETGSLRAAGGREPTDLLDASGTPPALREIVTRRLAGIGEDLRALLDVAAVDGFEFDGVAIAAAVDTPVLTALRGLQSLYRVQGLVVPRAQGYRFGHPLIQEVIEGEVAPDLRRILHRRLAEHMETRGAGIDPERLGTHWEQAGFPERASPHLLRAALAAARRQETARAVALSIRAGLDPEHPDTAILRAEPDTVIEMAVAYGECGRADERERLYGALLDVARDAGDEQLERRTLVRRAVGRYLTRGLEPGDEDAVRRAVEVLPHSLELAQARYVLGLIAKYAGRLEEAESWFRAADEVFVAHGAEGWHGTMLDQLGSVAMRAGRPSEGDALYAEAARACRRVGRFTNAAISEVNRATGAIARGALAGQRERVEDAMRVVAMDGGRGLAAQIAVVLAEVHAAEGDVAAAAAVVDGAARTLRETGGLVGLANALSVAAALALARGDLEPADAMIGELRATARRIGDSEHIAIACALESQRRGVGGDARGAADGAARAFAQLASHPESRGLADVAIRVAEAVLFGAPAACLAPHADACREAAERSPGGLSDTAWAAVRGVLALVDPEGTPETCEAAAAVLEGPTIGLWRALMRVLAARLRAGSARRLGDDAGAKAHGERALQAAADLGHVWHQAELTRFLELVTDDGAWSRRRRAILGPVVSRLADAEAREVLLAAWWVPDNPSVSPGS